MSDSTTTRATQAGAQADTGVHAGAPDAHAAHDPNLAHHFETPRQQYESGKLGMWIFLATEVLMFGGLFCAYSIYRANHPEIFRYGHHFLSTPWGAINTLVLITSSFTMAWAVRAAQLNQRRLLIGLLSLTLLGGFGFMGIKTIEYTHKYHEHVFVGPANRFHPAHSAAAPASPGPAAPAAATAPTTAPGAERSNIQPPPTGPVGLASPHVAAAQHSAVLRYEDLPPAEQHRVHIFFQIYFMMTGLHGVHVLVGMVLIGWILRRSIKGHFSSRYFTPVDLVGLYWHLVDLIWIFLFPLLYLIH